MKCPNPSCNKEVGCGCNLVTYLGVRMCKSCFQEKVKTETEPSQKTTPPASSIVTPTPVSKNIKPNAGPTRI